MKRRDGAVGTNVGIGGMSYELALRMAVISFKVVDRCGVEYKRQHFHCTESGPPLELLRDLNALMH